MGKWAPWMVKRGGVGVAGERNATDADRGDWGWRMRARRRAIEDAAASARREGRGAGERG